MQEIGLKNRVLAELIHLSAPRLSLYLKGCCSIKPEQRKALDDTLNALVELQRAFPIPLGMDDAKLLDVALERLSRGDFESFRKLTINLGREPSPTILRTISRKPTKKALQGLFDRWIVRLSKFKEGNLFQEDFRTQTEHERERYAHPVWQEKINEMFQLIENESASQEIDSGVTTSLPQCRARTAAVTPQTQENQNAKPESEKRDA
jgi:hypothetical protein